MRASRLAFALLALMPAACVGFGTPSTATDYGSAANARTGAKKLIIGSFNVSRGGIESLKASDVTGLRSAIVKMFHPQLRYAGKLSPKFMKRISVVILGVAKTISTGIRPLSKAEQTALFSFAKAGGTVIVFADNSDFQQADNSMLSPFGVAAAGKLNGYQTATWVDSSQNPLANGPAGNAQQLDTDYPGWLSTLGSALDLADFPGSGQSAAAYLPSGTLGSSSGPVVFFSDSSLMLDGVRTANDQIAILNALSLAR